jgi:hypothetical protein
LQRSVQQETAVIFGWGAIKPFLSTVVGVSDSMIDMRFYLILAGVLSSMGVVSADDPAVITHTPALPSNQVVSVIVPPPEARTNALALLRAADQARGNVEGIRWSVTVRTADNGRPIENVYDVQARGFNVLAEQTAPRKSKGTLMLVNQGNMWFYKPGVSKPVSISKRQRLSGNVANGDIATTNYAEDYDASFLPDTVISNELCYVLDLRAKPKRDCTYDRIVYAISQARGVGVKADYYTVSGKLFKTSFMTYDHAVKTPEGGTTPFVSRILFASAIASEESSELAFSPPVIAPLPPSIFDVNRLTR